MSKGASSLNWTERRNKKSVFAAGFSAPFPHHFTLIVILHLSLFAWRNAKHNEVQVPTQTPLPIPVYLTRRDTQTAWRHPHRQASTLAGKEKTITHPGDSHMARWSIESMCLLYKDLSLPVSLSLSLFSLLLLTLLPFLCYFHDSLTLSHHSSFSCFVYYCVSFTSLIIIPTQFIFFLTGVLLDSPLFLTALCWMISMSLSSNLFLSDLQL